MTPSWVQHWEVIAALVGLLIALSAWLLREDRKRVLDSVHELVDQISRLAEKLDNQREEMHHAVMRHETHLAELTARTRSLEAHVFNRRRSDAAAEGGA